MSDTSDQTAGEYWQSHYDAMARHESLELFDAEARDHFERLDRAIDLSSRKSVLDFGCGLGFVSALLCSRVAKLDYWDYAPNMRDAASDRLSAFPNASPVDLSSLHGGIAGKYDLIVINSVIQYMSEDELLAWLHRWRAMLAADGELIISDIILPEPAFFIEVRDSLLFARKCGFLLRTLKNDFWQYLRYLRARRHATMTRYSKEGFSALAGKAGLGVRFLDENLTYRSNRFTSLLSRS
jgi:cyclopropane fatty-acyl-phospholipid synthase-like methyltransferase